MRRLASRVMETSIPDASLLVECSGGFGWLRLQQLVCYLRPVSVVP